MKDLNDLYYFAAVVDHGGFTNASRALGIAKSRLSRHVALLEERLGVRLLQRSTRRIRLTEIGQDIHAHCREMLAAAEAAELAAAATHAEPCGLVRVACPIALLHAQVGEMLNGFMAKYPLVRLEIQAMNRPVDVVAEGIDLALRVRPSPLEDSELAVRIFGESPQCLVAAPSLLSEAKRPQTPEELADWPCLANGALNARHTWILHGPDGQWVEQAFSPRLATGDMLSLRRAAQAGLGIVQLPAQLVARQIENGSLTEALPGWAPVPEVLHGVFASRRGLVSSVRALIDYLAEAFAQTQKDR